MPTILTFMTSRLHIFHLQPFTSLTLAATGHPFLISVCPDVTGRAGALATPTVGGRTKRREVSLLPSKQTFN